MLLKEPLGRLDQDENLRNALLPCCRLKYGDIWEDKISGHRVMVGDATNIHHVKNLFSENRKAILALYDPPYNIIVGNKKSEYLFKLDVPKYIEFCRQWVSNSLEILDDDASFYVWLGADQNDHFQPLPEFMMMMAEFSSLRSRSLITMRNQRGYGTQKNWMALRQECLYYVVGNPAFNIEAEYTDIPKVLNGYYKNVNGELTDNLTRGKSSTIRAGNVWIDIQQVFYRLEENVPGCYAQKPIKSVERIIKASSNVNDLVVDLFSHSGTTLLASELLKRKAFAMDIDPLFAEISIRRLEHYRKFGKIGFQCQNPFPEVDNSCIQKLKENSSNKEPLDFEQLSFL